MFNLVELVRGFFANIRENFRIVSAYKSLRTQGFDVSNIMFFNDTCLVSVVDENDTDDMKQLLGFGSGYFNDVTKIGSRRIVSLTI